MRAVVLAGGLGMRLRPYTMVLPKPLVPIGDRPILELILRGLAGSGTRRADLCIGHLGELIQAYFSQPANVPDGLELAWHYEEEPLGTAGALGIVPDLDGTFIAMNGDILTDLDYRELVDYHRERGALLTVAMHRKRVQVELGVMDTDDGLVRAYHEKPSLDYHVSMGVYVYEPAALRYLPGGAFQFPELVEALLAAGETVAAFESDAEWFDIGIPEEYERAQQRYTGLAPAFGVAPVGDE